MNSIVRTISERGKTYRCLICLGLAAGVLAGCGGGSPRVAPTPEEARGIAKNAYIYGYPAVMEYLGRYAFHLDPENDQFRAPVNQYYHEARVFTPEDTKFVSPNSDTPYTWAYLDLRAEPIVLTVPEIDPDRYYSFMLLDMYTHIFALFGTRTTGNDAGSLLIAGPDWQGETPDGMKKVYRCETQFTGLVIRTQLFAPEDIEEVRQVQAQYGIQPLSSFLGRSASPAAATIAFPPIDHASVEGIHFYSYLNFLLQFCPVHPDEHKLRASFERIGMVPGQDFEPASLSPELQEALAQGIADAKAAIAAAIPEVKSAADLFGSREFLANDYLARVLGAMIGIGGLSKEEAFYIPYDTDSEGRPIDTAHHDYELRFEDGLPPVKAFWSITMYDAETRLLVANPLKRYLINSPMLPGMKLDADGTLTIYIQKHSPGAEKESNWLPAPDGTAWPVVRTYWPDAGILDGSWKAPVMVRVR